MSYDTTRRYRSVRETINETSGFGATSKHRQQIFYRKQPYSVEKIHTITSKFTSRNSTGEIKLNVNFRENNKNNMDIQFVQF